MTCPPNETLEYPDRIPYANASATDLSSDLLEVKIVLTNQSQDADKEAPNNVTIQMWTGTDGSNNSASCITIYTHKGKTFLFYYHYRTLPSISPPHR